METIKQNLSEFFNMPVSVATISVSIVAIMAYVIFTKTQWGKKAISALTAKFDEMLLVGKGMKKAQEEAKEEAEKKFEEYKAETDAKISASASYLSQLENFVYSIEDEIPNKKVREAIETFKNGKDERAKAIAEFVPLLPQVEEMKAHMEEERLKALEAQEEAKRTIDEVKALYEAKTREAEEVLAQLRENAQKEVTEVLEHEEGTDPKAD